MAFICFYDFYGFKTIAITQTMYTLDYLWLRKCFLSANLNGFNVRWWAPSKFDPVKSPMLFFEKGTPVMPPVPPDVGLDMVLKHMV